MFRAAILLSQKYDITFQGQYLTYEEVLTDNDTILIFNHTCGKISTSNIVGFVGPAYSNEARYVSSFAYRLGILDVSYSATSSDLSTIDTGAFYRVSPSDEKTVLGIKILFQQYKWRSCSIVYQNDEYGYNGMQLLSRKLSEIHIKTFETIKFDINQQSFQINLKKTLLSTVSRIVIVWANKISTRAILNKALDNDLIGQDFIWILTTAVALKDFNQNQQQKLLGILTLEPAHGDLVDTTINTTLLNEAYDIWKYYEYNTFPGHTNVNYYALFTFDATWSLILSLQKLCSMQSSCLEFMNTSDCYNRRFLNSKQYYNIMKTMTFLGVSGEVEFSSGTPDRGGRAYYVIKNVQSVNTTEKSIDYISVLQWNVDATQWTPYKNKSAAILWPNRSKYIPIDHKLIQGQELRIAIVESPPSIILNNPTATYSDMIDNFKRIDMTEFDGFYKDLLLYLQHRMGFIPVIMLAKPTTRYDELIDGVANDAFDIVIGSIDTNAKRNQIVDFSIAIMPGSYRILIRKPKSIQSDYLFLLKPFLWTLWLLLSIIIPYTNTLIWLVERKNNKNYRNGKSWIRIIIVFSYPFYKPLGRSHPNVQTNTGQFLTSILYILQTVLLVVYIAGLVLFLTIQNPDLTISGIDDIKNGKIPSNRVGILVGSQIEEYYLNSISQGEKDYYPLKTSDEVYTRLINGDIDASLWSNISTAYHVNNMYCDLMTVGVEFRHSFYQIPVRHGWLYTADLNFNILSFIESEQLDRISAKWFGRHNCSKTKLFDTETKTVALTTMSRLFITFALISLISILTHFWSRDHFIKIIHRIYRTDSAISAASTTSQFVLIDLSTRLNELASAMLDTLCLLTKDSILNFENSSTFDFDRLPKKTTVLLVSSDFAAVMKNKPEQVESIFILENDKNRVNHEDRFATGEDLICQLADEIYRCYEKEARAYSKSGDLKTAKLKEEQANRIHSELKKIHGKFFTRNITTKTPTFTTTTTTRLIWLKPKSQHNVEVERVRNLFSEVVSSFSTSDLHEDLPEYEVTDNIFLIIDTDCQDSVIVDFQQFPNIKLVGRYGQSSLENETVIDNYHDLCFRLIHDLIAHYNKLGTSCSAKQDTKTAEDMFMKAYKLCQMGLELKRA